MGRKEASRLRLKVLAAEIRKHQRLWIWEEKMGEEPKPVDWCPPYRFVEIETEQGLVREIETGDGFCRVVMIGELLNEAKKRVAHGEWGEWVKVHCGLSRSLAAQYIRVANGWDLLNSDVPKTHPYYLTLNQALCILRKISSDPSLESKAKRTCYSEPNPFELEIELEIEREDEAEIEYLISNKTVSDLESDAELDIEFINKGWSISKEISKFLEREEFFILYRGKSYVDSSSSTMREAIAFIKMEQHLMKLGCSLMDAEYYE